MRRLITKEDRAAAKSYYTAGRVRVAVKGLDLEFYLKDDGPGDYSAMTFKGTSGRPSSHYRYKTPEQRAAAIKYEIEAARSRQAAAAKYKADREVKSKLQVGHILVTCWGYDQTNREFYQVIATKGDRTIIVQELAQVSHETGWAQGKCTPDTEFAENSKPITCRVKYGSQATIEGHHASLWEGRPMDWSATH